MRVARRRSALPPLLLLLPLFLSGCLRRDGRNSDCRWPAESPRHSPSAWHLSADAEFAEDLAIRYADVHHGLRTPYYISGEDYVTHRDACRNNLFAAAAAEHRVPTAQVAAALGRNRLFIDPLELLPFALLYLLLSFFTARFLALRHPPSEGWSTLLLLSLLASVAFAFAFLMLGELSTWFLEGFRVGNPHMSYRSERLLWSRHPNPLFLLGLFLFWFAAAFAFRRAQPSAPLVRSAPKSFTL